MIRAVAGPEMDAAIAEHVFGSKKPDRMVDSSYDPQARSAESLCNAEIDGIWFIRGKTEFGRTTWGEWECPRYSVSITAAWIVAEVMRLAVAPKGNCWESAYCDWKLSGESLRISRENAGLWSIATTAPLAICIAALRATGIEVADVEREGDVPRGT